MNMSSMTTRSPVALARRDLSAGQAVALACGALAAVTAVDLADGRLGFLFSLGFVLAVATAPLSVDVRSLLTTGVMPPVLLVGALVVVAVVAPDAIVVDGLAADAGSLARALAAVVDHGITLVVGHVLALAGIGVRVALAPTR
jgi:uncharacterized protein DUF6542